MTVLFETSGSKPLTCEVQLLPAEVGPLEVGTYMRGSGIVTRLLAANTLLTKEEKKTLRATRKMYYPINTVERGFAGRTDYVVKITLGEPENE